MSFRPQSILMILLLASLTAIGPLSTDMYLASLPAISQAFATDTGSVQLTLSVYLIGWAGSMLVIGPAADKYGRKPIITAGLTLYTVASLLCVYGSGFRR